LFVAINRSTKLKMHRAEVLSCFVCVSVCVCVFERDSRVKLKVKVKQSHYRPGQHRGFQEVEAPKFQENRHMKMVRLSALRTGRLYQGNIPGNHSC